MVKILIIAAGILAALGLGQPAHAYLDPGAGSILIQIPLAAVAGAAAIVKLYRHSIRAYFSRGAAGAPEATDPAQGDSEKIHEHEAIAEADPGSFRDPGGRVLQGRGRIFRTVTDAAAADYEFVRDTGLIAELARQGLALPVEQVAGEHLGPAAAGLGNRTPFVPERFLADMNQEPL